MDEEEPILKRESHKAFEESFDSFVQTLEKAQRLRDAGVENPSGNLDEYFDEDGEIKDEYL